MTFTFASAQPLDIKEIMAIEQAGFTPDEAASETSMAQRIATISDTFIVAKDDTGHVAGYIVGPASDQRYITDDLFEAVQPNAAQAKYQTVLSLAVAPSTQGSGLGSQLLAEFARVAQTQNRVGITLTCLKRLVPFYEKNGYTNEGQADSDHAGEVWYNLVKEF
ncbi:putative acetyltransferase [Lactobacillus casei subsp. casei ATCC 393] [Lactiplantibacillus mudanjiangensis]|uniref:GNAT family N-acetyltransferase n=1 Tax=Lactiplantibacillus mudanjiangensis TaxID=1296538 RepID=UPI001013F1B1|nr:GNAT family N-acetyltransferase [Lactiplantibacillus mudanjiangensis]VDG31346.1 putative acetyltransferase [Lactobacillus casei subsp. casei ATCC 393] [Lactiplantibacillus mudanjiangensis]